jgi:methionyl-tRNA synthetase
LLYSVSRAIVGIAVGIAPVMPRFAAGLARAFGQESLPAWMVDFDPFDGATVAAAEKPPQIARLDAKQVEKLIVTTAGADEQPQPQPQVKRASPAEAATKARAAPSPTGVIQYDDFAKVELRVAIVKAAVTVAKADKLLQLTVDAGEPEPRTIVAGIAQAYPDPQVLVGRRIVVVANLAPRPLRGITSQGMLLAAGEPPDLQVVTVGDTIAPGTRVK